MSNRGRQNVASYLTKDLLIDWRFGAEVFESWLIDHDPASNYGNWLYVAGIGNDPREDRHFNMVKQAKDYDPDGTYVCSWIPCLRNRELVPEAMVHTPWKVNRKEFVQLVDVDGGTGMKYPLPLVVRPNWDYHSGRSNGDGSKKNGNPGERVSGRPKSQKGSRK
jgi:deoxyribodipyrimidine photo-lyase